MNRLLFVLLPVAVFLTNSCTHAQNQTTQNNQFTEATEQVLLADTIVADPLKADRSLTELARFFAGMPVDSSSHLWAKQQTAIWKSYARKMDAIWARSMKTYAKADSLGAIDMQDLRQMPNILYPFGGADFIYPTSFFPHAENYYMLGLEPAGSILSEKNICEAAYEKFYNAFRCILAASFFRTKDMAVDLNNQYVNGTLPIIMVMMARMDYQIASVSYKTLNENGELVDSAIKSKICEITYFKSGSNHLQHYFYFSTNISNAGLKTELEQMLDQLDHNQTVVYIKAASYLLHSGKFSKIREHLLHNEAIVQDDSGIPLRFMPQSTWDITLYGEYVHPLDLFSEACYQQDMVSAYANAPQKHPLDFRIGYDRKSNLQVARKKH